MSCKFASSSNTTNPPFLFQPDKSTRTRIPESISFASHVAQTRSIRSPFGPRGARPTARIGAFYASPGVACEEEESLYEVLGIAETGSTLSDIKKAYKKMARKYHPDVAPPERVDEHTRRFIMVKEAYETLSDPQRRALYDRELAVLGSRVEDRIRMNETVEWKIRWQAQLDELKRRSMNPTRGRTSRGARMRT